MNSTLLNSVERVADAAPYCGSDATSTALHWMTFSSLEVDEAMVSWRLLAERIQSHAITCSPTWTHCWIRHYGSITPFRIVMASSDGIVRGMALLTEGVGRRAGPFSVRTRHLGTAGEPQAESPFVEYNRLLVEPGFEQSFIAGLARMLDRDLTWDQLHFDGFHESDLKPLLSRFPQAEVNSRESRYADLECIRKTAAGDLLSQLGKSTRANIRRRLRDYGKLECTWASTLELADEIFAEMVQLHQARWQATGQPGAFAQSRFRRFQHDLMIRGVMEKRVVLFRVRHQGTTVGSLMLLADGTRLLDYLSGFASFDEKPSPGLMTHYLCMQQALERGFSAYDFLVGDKRHKENLSTSSTQICWATVNRPSLKMRAIDALRHAKRRWSKLRKPGPGINSVGNPE